MFQQIESKPYRGEIEKHMAAMTLHLHPPSCLKLRVEDLGKARVILKRVIVQYIICMLTCMVSDAAMELKCSPGDI